MKIYQHNIYYRMNELELIPKLMLAARLTKKDRAEILETSNVINSAFNESSMIHQLMVAYELSGNEGIALMTLCECLLRTPDKKTQDKLIKEKLTNADWNLLSQNSFYATLCGKVLTNAQSFAAYNNLISRLGWPTVRKIIKESVKRMGNIFVMAESIEAQKLQ